MLNVSQWKAAFSGCWGAPNLEAILFNLWQASAATMSNEWMGWDSKRVVVSQEQGGGGRALSEVSARSRLRCYVWSTTSSKSHLLLYNNYLPVFLKKMTIYPWFKICTPCRTHQNQPSNSNFWFYSGIQLCCRWGITLSFCKAGLFCFPQMLLFLLTAHLFYILFLITEKCL